MKSSMCTLVFSNAVHNHHWRMTPKFHIKRPLLHTTRSLDEWRVLSIWETLNPNWSIEATSLRKDIPTLKIITFYFRQHSTTSLGGSCRFWEIIFYQIKHPENDISHVSVDHTKSTSVRTTKFCKNSYIPLSFIDIMSSDSSLLRPIVFLINVHFTSHDLRTLQTLVFGAHKPKNSKALVTEQKVTVCCAVHVIGVVGLYYFCNETVSSQRSRLLSKTGHLRPVWRSTTPI